MGLHASTNEVHVCGFSRDQRRRGLAASTVLRRQASLRRFGMWLNRDLLAATSDDVERFIDTLREHNGHGGPAGARTRYRWLSDLHCFYAWAIRHDLAAADPTLKIDRPKLRRLLPRPIADANLSVAVDLADRRIRAMLACAYLGGARASEIAFLTREDVLEGERPPVVIWHGKGRKDRVVPLHPDLALALGALPMPRSGRVFHRTDGRPMTPLQVSRELNEWLHSLGIGDTAHSLRHWSGSRYLAATGNLRKTQEFLGHENPATTAIYTRVVVGDLVAGVNALHLCPPDPVADPPPAVPSATDNREGRI